MNYLSFSCGKILAAYLRFHRSGQQPLRKSKPTNRSCITFPGTFQELFSRTMMIVFHEGRFQKFIQRGQLLKTLLYLSDNHQSCSKKPFLLFFGNYFWFLRKKLLVVRGVLVFVRRNASPGVLIELNWPI